MGTMYVPNKSKVIKTARKMARNRYRKRIRRRVPFTQLRLGSGTGIPPVLYLKLKFTELRVVGPAQVNSIVFRGNDIYSPYDGAGGNLHQPYLSDQFARLYNRFTVYASKIKLTSSCDQSLDHRVVLRPTNSNSAVSDWDLSVERPYSKYKVITAEKPATIKHFMKSKTIIGVNDIDDDDYAGGLSSLGPASSPNTKWYWTVATSPMDGTNQVTTNLLFEITYYVKFWQRVNQASS